MKMSKEDMALVTETCRTLRRWRTALNKAMCIYKASLPYNVQSALENEFDGGILLAMRGPEEAAILTRDEVVEILMKSGVICYE